MAKAKMLQANTMEERSAEPHVQMAVLIPKTLHTALKIKAINQGRYMNRLIRDALYASVKS